MLWLCPASGTRYQHIVFSLHLLIDQTPYYHQLELYCLCLWYLCHLPTDLHH
jgi:hypothetical protein